MENKKKCALCFCDVDADKSAILAMGGFGYPRYLCEECETLIDKVSNTEDYNEFMIAKEKLVSRCHPYLSDDKVSFETLCSILDSATERAEQIKEGVYDFSSDSVEEKTEGFEEIPDELKETEEDRQLDLRDEEVSRKADKILNWVMLAAFIGVVGFFVYYFFFR